MKKSILIICTILLLTGCFNRVITADNGHLYAWNFMNPDEEGNPQIHEILSADSITIYVIGYEGFKVNYKDSLISLKRYYELEDSNNDKLLEDLMYELIVVKDIDELEATLYDNVKDDAMLLKCHTSSGVNDIYLAKYNLENRIDDTWMIEHNLCKTE